MINLRRTFGPHGATGRSRNLQCIARAPGRRSQFVGLVLSLFNAALEDLLVDYCKLGLERVFTASRFRPEPELVASRRESSGCQMQGA